MAAGAPITLGHAFAKGDVPAGSFQRLIASTTRGRAAQVQVDQTNAWSDGSLRFAALSFRSPIAFTAGQVASFQLGIGSGALTGAALTPTQTAARFALKVHGGDYGRDTFTVDAASIVATKPRFTLTQTAGANPSAYWELIRSGPICTEVKVTGFLKRDGDAAIHSFDKAVLYLRAWNDGNGNIIGWHALPSMRMENVYGPLAGTSIGGSLPRARAGIAELYNGSTLVRACGGRNDPNGLATVKLYPQSGWTGATVDGYIPWTGSIPAPSYMVAHDLAYLTRRTRMFLPYDLNTVRQPWTGHDPFIINGDIVWPAGLDTTGDGIDDERIGFVHLSALRSLLNPFDKAAEQRMYKHGFVWAEWQIWQTDERSGKPVNTSLSSAHSPSPPNPSFSTRYSCDQGNPHWCGPWNATRQNWNQYGFLMTNAHTPSPWIIPLLRSGHQHFVDQGISHNCAMLNNHPSVALNGTTYDSIITGFWHNESNIRGIAWQLNGTSTIEMMMPDTDAMRPYLRYVMDQNAAFAAVGPDTPSDGYLNLGLPYVTRDNAGWGVYGVSGSGGMPGVFQVGMVAACLAMQEWRAEIGERQGWRAMLEKWRPSAVGFWDDAKGGSSYYASAYSIFPRDANKVDFPNVPAMIRHYGQGRKAYPPPRTGLLSDYGFSYSAGQCSCPGGFVESRIGVAMMAWLDTPIERSPEVWEYLNGRVPLYDGTGPYPATISYVDSAPNGWYPTWSIAPPESRANRRAAVGSGPAFA